MQQIRDNKWLDFGFKILLRIFLCKGCKNNSFVDKIQFNIDASFSTKRSLFSPIKSKVSKLFKSNI